MADMFDYLEWRGDILFTQMPPNPVDALIFSSLAYIGYEGIVSETMSDLITLKEFAENFLPEDKQINKKVIQQKKHDETIRVKSDLKLLKAAAESKRFANVSLCSYRDILLDEEETQFAAITFLLGNGSAFLAFRGTDYTLTGWKEDFNMTFQDEIPSQKLAVEYVQEFSEQSFAKLYLGGHSKGGNLAVYAAAKCEASIQERIQVVYNQDGPGFTDNLMGHPGYLAMVPKIRTYIPQSSIVGMLLEHEEPYSIIKSRQVGGALQHDPYSWEVMGPDFIYLEEVTKDSRLLERTIKSWMASMTNKERDVFVDSLFELLTAGGAEQAFDLIRPKNIITYLKTLKSDDEIRKTIAKELAKLIMAIRKEQNEDS